MNRETRRNTLKSIAFTLPVAWAQPVVQSVILPAHAVTSPECGPNPDCDFIEVIDLDGLSNIQGNPVVVVLPAGLYTATPIDDSFTAWTKWGDTPDNCDTNGENCVHGWLNSFTVVTSQGELEFGAASGTNDGYETPEQALDNAEVGTFCLSQTEQVQFFLRGESVGEEDDNAGGMSLLVRCSSASPA